MKQVTVTCAFVMLAIAAARCDASDFAEGLLVLTHFHGQVLA